jgi:crotonobetainyl-CoA:carnitine CoA-transferase CaiB-like acyl-CoA transferase
VLGLPGLPDDPRFTRNQDRTANREELRPILIERLIKRTKDEWFRELLAAGVPCAPINTIDGGVALAQELGLDPVVTIDGTPGVRNPITFSSTPAVYRLSPPGLNEHGEEIRQWLTEN